MIGFEKQASAWCVGTGKRTPDETEQFCGDQLAGHRGAVDCDELTATGACLMHQLGETFLAGARFSQHQDG
jgi:hypothetical protein